MLFFCYSFFLPFFVMRFMFLVDEMKFMLISSRHFDVQKEILNFPKTPMISCRLIGVMLRIHLLESEAIPRPEQLIDPVLKIKCLTRGR